MKGVYKNGLHVLVGSVKESWTLCPLSYFIFRNLLLLSICFLKLKIMNLKIGIKVGKCIGHKHHVENVLTLNCQDSSLSESWQLVVWLSLQHHTKSFVVSRINPILKICCFIFVRNISELVMVFSDFFFPHGDMSLGRTHFRRSFCN